MSKYWYPTIDYDKCEGCFECIQFCPNGVYLQRIGNNRPIVANPDNCIDGCKGCETICADAAISFPCNTSTAPSTKTRSKHVKEKQIKET